MKTLWKYRAQPASPREFTNTLAVCTIMVRRRHRIPDAALPCTQSQIILASAVRRLSGCIERTVRTARTSHLRGTPLNIVVADDLPASALEVLRAEGWDIDARTGRTPDQLAADLANADAIVVRSATKVTAAIIAAAARRIDFIGYSPVEASPNEDAG